MNCYVNLIGKRDERNHGRLIERVGQKRLGGRLCWTWWSGEAGGFRGATEVAEGIGLSILIRKRFYLRLLRGF